MEIGTLNTMFKACTPGEMARRIREHGFSKTQIDLAFNGKAYATDELTKEVLQDIRGEFESHGIKIVAISGHQKLAFTEKEANIAARNSFMEKLKLPKRLGCSVIVSETGSANPDNAWTDHPNNYLPEVWEMTVESMRFICNRAREEGVIFALEPHFGQLTKDPKTLRRMLDDVDSPNLKLALDMANMITPAYASNIHALIDEFFDLCGSEIAVVHAKDTKFENGKAIFVGAGQGAMDYPYFLKRLKNSGYGGPVLIEYVNEAGLDKARDFIAASM